MRPLHSGVIGVAAFLTLLGTAPVAGQDPTRVDWLTDRAKAFAEARRTGKPIWVLFR